MIAARMHVRDLERAASRAPRLVPLGRAAKLRHHVHAYSVAVLAISVLSMVTLGVLSGSGMAV